MLLCAQMSKEAAGTVRPPAGGSASFDPALQLSRLKKTSHAPTLRPDGSDQATTNSPHSGGGAAAGGSAVLRPLSPGRPAAPPTNPLSLSGGHNKALSPGRNMVRSFSSPYLVELFSSACLLYCARFSAC